MKRFLIMFMVLGLLAGSVSSAGARKKKIERVERTVEVTYDAPFVPMTVCGDWLGLSWGCVDVPTRKTEAFFTAKATDAHGQPVAVAVYSRKGNVRTGEYGVFCGETADSIGFEPGAELTFVVGPHWPVIPTNLDCPMGTAATTGTISVTLSNVP